MQEIVGTVVPTQIYKKYASLKCKEMKKMQEL